MVNKGNSISSIPNIQNLNHVENALDVYVGIASKATHYAKKNFENKQSHKLGSEITGCDASANSSSKKC